MLAAFSLSDTACQDKEAMRKVEGDLSDGKAPGLDNLLYSADADFSCFAVRLRKRLDGRTNGWMGVFFLRGHQPTHDAHPS